MENLKKMAGIKAAEFVSDGMVVGLGTGSTAYYFVEEIGRRIKEEGLQITAVTTSSVTTKQAEGLNIPLKSIDQVDFVDVTVDGADEVDSQFNGIKGGVVPFSWKRWSQHHQKNTFGWWMKASWSKN
ncbi:ribose-5-phosphate isomerase A [Streptococcus pneumoniae]|nr:ribose-5-phosphate isomerase A [Streptococcus pneumoniae]